MELLTSILDQFIGVGVLAAIILFQQEIRRFLLMIGKTTDFNDSFIKNLFKLNGTGGQFSDVNLTPIIEAVKVMSSSKIGALIVFGKSRELTFYEDSGDSIGAEVSKRLLLSIFAKNSPLHDGAVTIRDQKITAARCILPVSDTPNLPAQYGLRHRAALGLAEITSSLIVVVSEETGQVSLAHHNRLEMDLTIAELRGKLNFYLLRDPQNETQTTTNETIETENVTPPGSTEAAPTK